jgi:hypothetical protein
MIENGIPNPVPVNELHCTIVNSTVPVPGYLPEVEHVTISPSTFQLKMLNSTLVVSFSNSTLDQHHWNAISQGATSDFAKFCPHISISYKVPTSFSLADVKPPMLPLTLTAEQIQEQDRNWIAARSFTDPISMKNALDPFQLEDFISFLEEERHITVIERKLPINQLKASQNVDETRVERMTTTPTRVLSKPYLVSEDNSLFDADGHLRWTTLLRRSATASVTVRKVCVTAERLQQLFEEYSGS